jgi:hypothetical protein
MWKHQILRNEEIPSKEKSPTNNGCAHEGHQKNSKKMAIYNPLNMIFHGISSTNNMLPT